MGTAAIAAYQDAARQSWDVAALSETVGEQIAGLADVAAACVTSGAAAGLALAVAACAVRGDPAAADALPVPGKYKVVAQAATYNSYDRMARLCGADIVTAGYPSRAGLGQSLPWQLDAAIDGATVAVLHTVTADPGALPLSVVSGIARTRGVPVIVDAAAELPPATNLGRFLAEGADVVVFSGGKALRGPQASGLLLGDAVLVHSARMQSLDMDADPELWRSQRGDLWQHGIGRAMKVGPATMLSVLAALRQFLATDHQAQAAEMNGWLTELAGTLGSGTVCPPATREGFYPSLSWDLGPGQARRAWRALAARQPSLRLTQSELSAGRLRLRPEALEPAHRPVVTARLTEAASILVSVD